MKNLLKYALVGAALVLCSVIPARANGDVMTFEGLQNNEEILNYYNGGLGSLGSGPGPNYGVVFGSDSLALISVAGGGSGNFANNPSGDTIAYFLSGSGDVMNVAAGFTTGFSFYYSAVYYPGTVNVYSGTDGTGSLLATLNLPLTGPPGSYPTAFNSWDPIGVTFAGTAMSAIFGGTDNQIGFDNITIGSATPGGVVPEPSSFALAGLGGLCLVGYYALRRRTAATA